MSEELEQYKIELKQYTKMDLFFSARVRLTDDIHHQLRQLIDVLSVLVQELPDFELLPPGVTIKTMDEE